MPSLANYMIATQIKDYVIENKNRLEKKYIVPLTFHQALCLCFFIGWLGGFAVRIKYNGFYGALANSFQWCWYGLGWGNVPWYIAISTAFVGGSIGGLFGHYIMNVRFRHNNQPTVTLYETYTLMYNTLKYQFLRMLCRQPQSFHWD
tara:strand:+ start:285 stop:725 length:441 start_codon:yes stop_codon:yes gene_type:complete